MSVTFSTDRPSVRVGYAVCCYAYGSDQDWYGPTHPDIATAIADHESSHHGNVDCDGTGTNASVHTRRDTDDDPSVNMSNGNAAHLLATLGFDTDELLGSTSAEDFLGRVLVALAVAPIDAGIPAHDISEGGAQVVNCGRPEGYTQHRLDQLRTLAEFARSHDANVSWG